MDDLMLFEFHLGRKDLPLLASLDPDTGTKRIEGVSSSTLRDGHGDEMTVKALEKMAKSAIGMTVWLNHDYEIPKSVFGTITKAKVVDSGERDPITGYPIIDLLCGMDVMDESDNGLKTFKMIQKGSKFGISVGAMVPEGGVTKSQNGGRYIIDDVDLIEMSLVGVPANSRCWATVATKALKGHPDFVVKEAELPEGGDGEELEKVREGEQTSKIDVEEGTDPDGRSDGIVTGSDILPDAQPDPDAKPAEAEEVAEDGQKDKDSVEAGDGNDGIVTADEIVPEVPEQKSRITVWDGDKTVQIDTGRQRKAGDDHSAQDDSPESAGGLPSSETKALTVGASSEPLLIKALRQNLTLAMNRVTELEGERDRAYEHAAAVVEKTAGFIDQIGAMPMGRRATFEGVQKSFDHDFSDDLDKLTFLDPSVKRLLQRRNREAEAETGSPNQ